MMQELVSTNDNLGLSLHHIGYVVRTINTIAANYVSRFGYELVTPIIHDPLQTALVQFLKLPGDRTYLEYVAPDGPDSKLVNAAKRAGLNHLCFTSGPRCPSYRFAGGE